MHVICSGFGSNKTSLLHQFEEIKSEVLNEIKQNPHVTPQLLLDTLNFLELPELKRAYEKDTVANSDTRRTCVVTKLFQNMSLLFTFTEFNLLHHIVTKTMLNEKKYLRRAIELYACRVQAFKARTTVKQLMNSPPCQHDFPPGFSVFRIEIQEYTSLTLKELDALIDTLCETIKQKSICNVLNFIGVHTEQITYKETTVPCFFAVWRFPTNVVSVLKKAVERNGSAVNNFCKINSILTISVDGKELLHHEEEVSSHSMLTVRGA